VTVAATVVAAGSRSNTVAVVIVDAVIASLNVAVTGDVGAIAVAPLAA
jgi:hypothetical protein